MAVEIGALRALLSLDSAAFETGANRARASMGALRRNFGDAAKRIARVGATMGVAVVTGMGAMARSAMNSAHEIERLSTVANADAEVFQRWAAGSRSVGIEQDKLADILKDVNDRIGDFNETGGGPMADFFENIAPKVGVTADQFARLSGPEALQLYVTSLEKAGASQAEMTFYMEALASDATLLLPLLRNNGEAMDNLGDRAASLGAIMDKETIAKLREARGAFAQIGTAVTGLKNQLIVSMLPAIEAAAAGLTNFLTTVAADGWAAAFRDVWEAVQAVIAGWAADFVQLGEDLMQGLVDGLMAKWESVKDTVKGIGTGMVTSLKDLFGIQSPSRVFADIGRDLMAGLGLGIDANANDPLAAMLAAGRTVSDAVTVAMDAAAGAADGFGTRFASFIQPVIRGTQSISDAFRSMAARIGDSLISSGLQGIGSALFGGGSGSVFGDLLGGIFGGFRADGGPVSAGRAYVVGERGPEVFMPRNAGTIIPNGGGFGGPQSLDIRVSVDGARGDREIEAAVRRGVAAGIGQYDRQLPGRVAEINRKPHERY